jgi:hypothetical protein
MKDGLQIAMGSHGSDGRWAYMEKMGGETVVASRQMRNCRQSNLRHGAKGVGSDCSAV